MKFIHIVQFHLMAGGGVGSVITDLCQETAKQGDEVYVISLFQRKGIDFEIEKQWGNTHGIKVFLMQNTPTTSVLKVLYNLRTTIKQLCSSDKCCLFLHLKWGVLAGIISSLGISNIKRVEVYHSGYLDYKLQAFLSKPFIHHYIAVSKDAKQQLINWFGVSEDKISVVYNGVDIEYIKSTIQNVKKENDIFLYMSVGRLSYEKGFLTPIGAYSNLIKDGRLPKTSYTMIGKGEQMKDAKMIAVNEVNFIGLIPRNQVYPSIASCDVMVLPSLWEGNSILLLEVLSIGKALIVSDIPSYREVLDFQQLQDDETCRIEPFGVVFKTNDIKSCMDALQLIYTNSDKITTMNKYVSNLATPFSISTQAKSYKKCASSLFK